MNKEQTLVINVPKNLDPLDNVTTFRIIFGEKKIEYIYPFNFDFSTSEGIKEIKKICNYVINDLIDVMSKTN
jgi:hypothetical protein